MPARILPFQRKGTLMPGVSEVKAALIIAAVFMAVVYIDNMVGKKISTALAA
jgi:hypothetical protein